METITLLNLTSPPTIPASIKENSNETSAEKVVQQLYTTTLTDGVATLSGGTLSNLVDPTADNEAATKNYILTNGPFVPAGVNTNVQIRGTTTFDADADFTFDKNTNILTFPELTDGTATLTGGLLSDILDPTSLQDAATKNYVDNTSIKTSTTLSSATGITYTATQMVNGVIERRGLSLTTPITSDTTATAAAIVAEFSDAKVGMTATFAVYVDAANVALGIVGGTGVTVEPVNPILYGYYYLYGRIILNNVTGGSEAVTLHIDAISFNSSFNWNTGPNWSFLTQSINDSEDKNTVTITDGQVTEELLTPMSPVILTDQNHTYTFEEISTNRIVIRSGLVANSSDTFPTAAEFIASGDILTLGRGGMEFLVQNIDPTFSITLTAATGWTLNGDLTIAPGQNGLFMVEVDTVGSTCTLYSLGPFQRNG